MQFIVAFLWVFFNKMLENRSNLLHGKFYFSLAIIILLFTSNCYLISGVSAKPSIEEATPQATELPTQHQLTSYTEQRQIKYPDKLFYSDEFISDEYDDDSEFVSKPNEWEINNDDRDWDLLIFTQQWPVTTCYHWREEDKTHGCSLPTQKEFWTIHGIWPTKLGHFGPNFCNRSAHFDINQLQEIKDRLRLYWRDIDPGSKENWFWQHEWLKHGTCAAAIEDLSDELKYFNQGLEWRNNYLISDILDESNIHPDSNNTVTTLQEALVKRLGKNPSIHCLYDNKHDISYLAEIRICFNKTLDIVDCDGVKFTRVNYPGGRVITNCHISKLVHYPSLVPSPQRADDGKKWSFPVVNLYKLIQFIMWFTL